MKKENNEKILVEIEDNIDSLYNNEGGRFLNETTKSETPKFEKASLQQTQRRLHATIDAN